MPAWIATRKVRHIGVMSGTNLADSQWMPLCQRPWHPRPQTMWLGTSDYSDHVQNGNFRRSMRARWRHPACTRCLAELAAMVKLVADDTVHRALVTAVDDVALFTGRPPAEVTAALGRALTEPARPLSTHGPIGRVTVVEDDHGVRGIVEPL